MHLILPRNNLIIKNLSIIFTFKTLSFFIWLYFINGIVYHTILLSHTKRRFIFPMEFEPSFLQILNIITLHVRFDPNFASYIIRCLLVHFFCAIILLLIISINNQYMIICAFQMQNTTFSSFHNITYWLFFYITDMQ